MQMFVVLCEIKANPRCGNIKSVNIFSLSLFELTPLQSPTPSSPPAACLKLFPCIIFFTFMRFILHIFLVRFLSPSSSVSMFEKMLRKYLRFYVQFLPFAFDICIPCKGYGVSTLPKPMKLISREFKPIDIEGSLSQ